MRSGRWRSLLAALALGAVGLRLLGVWWGLPGTYNADEPHVVNLALSFGAGTLRPVEFKYPSLWPYLLFVGYGIRFVVMAALGLVKSAADYAALYAWDPGGFYLLGRLFSVAASLLGLVVMVRIENERDGDRAPWAAGLLAFSPLLIELAQTCKPDSLLFLMSSLAWLFALRVFRSGRLWDHRLCGLFLGMALGSQYTALPLFVVLPLSHSLSSKRPSVRALVQGVAFSVLGFFLSCPYAFLEPRRFLDAQADFGRLTAMTDWSRLEVARKVVWNILDIGGLGWAAFVLLIVGLVRLWPKERRYAVLLSTPFVLYAVLLINSPDGGWARYFLAALPGLAVLASEGASWRPAGTALAVLALTTGAVRAASLDMTRLRPDTRQAATAWIAASLPAGAGVLIDEVHASPTVRMAKEQAEELARRSAAAGSPRARLYGALAATHPGGGLRVYQIARSADDLRAGPEHVSRSQSDRPTLDASRGLAALERDGVDFVVTTSFGATPERSPRLAGFFSELEAEGEILATFSPEPGRVEGPEIRVWRLPPVNARRSR